MTKNKWALLPSLGTPRERPGTVLLPSLAAFCFCGKQDIGAYTKSVERLQVNGDLGWETLPIDDRIPSTYQLTVIPFQGSLLVLGGNFEPTVNNLKVSEEGVLLESDNDDPIPFVL